MKLQCSKCSQEKDSADFTNAEQRKQGYRRCRDCTRAANRLWQERNPGPRKRDADQLARKRARDAARRATGEGKQRTADAWYRYRYGLTVAEIDAKLAAQNHLCGVCGQAETRRNKKTGELQRLAVDHNHATGQPRMMLCHRCNWLVAQAGDDSALLRRAADYIDAHAQDGV